MEQWKDIEGYEGLYQVSSEGRVRSLPRTIVYSDGQIHYYDGCVLKQTDDKDGYKLVHLCSGGIRRNGKVHRLVAQAFIPNPNSLPEVNHKNEDKTLNTVENLEWCDKSHNMNWNNLSKRIGMKLRNHRSTSKAVVQMTPDNKIVCIYPSTREAERQTGFSHGNISNCISRKLTTYRGYIWQYISDTNI